MDARLSPTASMSSAFSSKASGCVCATCPTLSPFNIPLDQNPCFRILFGYRIGRFPGTITLHGQERTTTYREDEGNGCVDPAGRQKEGVEPRHLADREE